MSVGRQGCSNNGNVSVRTIKIFIGLFLGYGYYNTMRGTFSQQLRSIASELQIPLSRIGLPASMFSAAYGVGKFLTSIVSDYVPCAECHALGLLLCGINIAALGLCTSLTSLSWLWCLQGFVQACGWPFLARIVVTELPSGHRAKFWGVLSMAGSLGAMLSPYGMVFARQWGMSWQRAFFFAGGSSIAASLIVGWLLCGNASLPPQLDVKKHISKTELKSESFCASFTSILCSPVLLALMACNSLSFGASKCVKEWGAIYLQSTRIAATDTQAATLLFWAEVGGSCSALVSGFVCTRLGGRIALTCLLFAILASVGSGVLAICAYQGMHANNNYPVPFSVACMLQAMSLAGINGIRTLTGLHVAEVASSKGLVGMANAWSEILGQMGSVMAGQPVGALAAFISTPVNGPSAGWNSAVGWVGVLALLTAAPMFMGVFNALLLPQEELRLQKQQHSKVH